MPPFALTNARQTAVVLALAGCVAWATPAAAQTWQQTATGTYSWNLASNWDTNTVPNGLGVTANVNDPFTGSQTINLDVPITVGTLNLGPTSGGGSFTIAPGAGGLLTFAAATMGGTTALNVTSGAAGQTIGADVALSNALTVTQNSTVGTLFLNGNLGLGGNDLTFAGPGNVTVNGVISGATGSNGVAFNSGTSSGTRTIILNAANTYTGATSITNSVVKLGVNNALPTGTALSLSASFSTAILDLNGHSQTLGSLSGSNGQISNADADAPALLTVSSGSSLAITFGGSGANNFGLVKTGSGVLSLANFNGVGNTFTGGLWVAGGNVTASSSGGAHAQLGTGAATVLPGATLRVEERTSIQSLAGGLTVLPGGEYNQAITSQTTVTLPAAGLTISGFGNGTGPIYNLSGTTNTFAAAGGPLKLAGDASIGQGAFVFNNQVIGGSSQVFLNGGTTLTNDSTATPNTMGNVFVPSGTLTVGANNALGIPSARAAAGSVTFVTGSGRVIAASTSATPAVAENITLTTFNFNNGTSVGMLQAGAANQNFTGTITLANTGGNGPSNVGGATSSTPFDFTISGRVTGPGTFQKDATNTVTLSGTNDYAGFTLINSGTLKLGGPAALPATAGVFVGSFGTAATLDLNGQSPTVASLGDNTSSSSTTSQVINTGAAAALTTGTGTFQGTLGAGSQGSPTSANLGLTVTGFFTLNSFTANTYTGATAVKAGTFSLDPSHLTPVSGQANNLINPASTLQLGGGTLQWDGVSSTVSASQTFNNAVVVNPGGSTVTVFPNGGTATLALGGGFSRTAAGGTVNFTTVGGGTATITTTATNVGSTGILGAWATFGGDNWAAVTTGTVGALGSYSSSFATGTNVSLTASASTGALTINSLRYANSSVTATLNGDLTITSGGILATSSAGGFAHLSGTGSVLVPGGTPDLIVQASGQFATLTIDTTVGNGTTNAFALTKAGPGTLFLNNAANAYTGKTFLNSGTLRIAADGSLGTATGADSITVNGGGLLQFNYAGALATARGVTLNAGGGGFDTFGHNVTYGGVIAGTGGFTKAGTFTLTLTGANTYAGATTVTGGTLQIDTANNVLPTGTVMTLNGGTTFDLNGRSQQLGGLKTDGTTTPAVINAGAAAALTLNELTSTPSVSGPLVYAGVIGKSGSANISLVKTGYGILQLNNNGSLYTGPTTVTGGTVSIATDGATAGGAGTLGMVPATPTAGNVVLNGGALSASATLALHPNRGIALGPNAGTLDVPNSGTVLTYNGAITDNGATGSLIKTGDGTLKLGGSSTYSGTTEVRGGTIQLGAANALPAGTTLVLGNPVEGTAGVFDLAGLTQTVGGLRTNGQSGVSNQVISSGAGTGTLTVNVANGGSTVRFDGQLGGGTPASPANANFNLVKTGPGTFEVAGVVPGFPRMSANSYTGTTDVQNGTLRLSGIANVLPTTTSVNLGNGANSGVLDLNGQAQTVAGLTTSGGGTGNQVVNSLSQVGGALTVNLAGTATFAGSLGGTGGQNNFSFTKDGAGSLMLTGADTYTGGTTVANGTLVVGAANALPSGGALTLNGGTLDLGGNNPTFGTVNLNGGTVTGGSLAGSSYAVQSGTAGNLGGSGSLTKTGTGTVTLTGTNTYSGATVVSAGTLAVNGTLSAGGGAVTVGSGGTLGGSGTINRPVTVAGGGTVSPGNSPGTLTVADAAFQPGGNYTWELNSVNASPTTQDLLSGTGRLDLSGLTSANKFNVLVTSLTPGNTPGAVSDFNNTQPYTWTLATFAGGIVNPPGGFNGNLFNVNTTNFTNTLNPANTFSVAQSGNSLQLQFSPVPEPTGLLLVCAAAAGAAVRVRRRWRAAAR